MKSFDKSFLELEWLNGTYVPNTYEYEKPWQKFPRTRMAQW